MKSDLQLAMGDLAFIDLMDEVEKTANYFVATSSTGVDSQAAVQLLMAKAYLAGKKLNEKENS